MKLEIGSQQFLNVEIPLLWGSRAILVNQKNEVSVILLEGDNAVLEILDNQPASNIQYELIENGFKIIKDNQDIYSFDSQSKIITGISLNLPECEIKSTSIRIGTNVFSGNTVVGYGVGIFVDEQGGMSMGAPFPKGLAKLAL